VRSFRFWHAQPLVRHNPGTRLIRRFCYPAATGLTDLPWYSMRPTCHQWVGIKDAPNIQSFSATEREPRCFTTAGKGIGLNLVRDVNGPSKKYGRKEILYFIPGDDRRSQSTWLSFGLSGSLEQNRLDESGFSPVFDPCIRRNGTGTCL